MGEKVPEGRMRGWSERDRLRGGPLTATVSPALDFVRFRESPAGERGLGGRALSVRDAWIAAGAASGGGLPRQSTRRAALLFGDSTPATPSADQSSQVLLGQSHRGVMVVPDAVPLEHRELGV